MVVGMSSVAWGQISTNAPKLEFEVASVKPAVFPSPAFAAGFAAGSGDCGGGTLSVAGNRINVSPATICALIRIAYGVKGYQVLGMPSAPKINIQAIGAPGKLPEAYDIRAEAGANTVTTDQARAMLRTLLADRFQIKLHHEMKEMPVYTLVTTRSKLKLNPSTADCRPHPSMEFAVSACDWSMDKLVDRLTQMTDRPVLDRTELAGTYQFDMHRPGDDPRTGESGPTLFTVVEELGLKLVAEKAPLEVLVVDHFEQPSAN
jgi:uncharacterized protein (TIGR03435 family)